jgi:ribonuclease P protein component
VRKNAFPKRLRLLGNDEFKAVLAKRRRLSDDLLAVYAAPNGREYSRLGISAGTAAGNAVVRNRFKRLVREVFRQNCARIPAGSDYVVIPLSKIAKRLTFENVKESFLKLAGRIEC